MSEADAFLDAIWAAPGDDLPRLVYADWLEDHGYPGYARFIRLSRQLAREVMAPDERTRLRRERYRLGQVVVKAHPRAFAGCGYGLGNSDYGISTQWHTANTEVFLEHYPHWWPFVWPRSLCLLAATGFEAMIARCEYLSRLDVLECEGRVDSPYYDVGERDEVNWQPVAGFLLRELIANPGLPRLTALKVQPIEVSATDLGDFGESSLAERLEELHLWVQLADGGREDLRASSGFIQHEIARFLTIHADRLTTRRH